MTPKDLRELNMVVQYYPNKKIWIGNSRPVSIFWSENILFHSIIDFNLSHVLLQSGI